MGKGGESSTPGLKKFSVSELRKHNTAGDGWVAINGKVYDVSQYVNQHPGGRVLLSALGEPDASGAWAAGPRRALPPPAPAALQLGGPLSILRVGAQPCPRLSPFFLRCLSSSPPPFPRRRL